MNSSSKYDDVLFMSSGQFEQLTDTESFVFSHIAFFACQQKPYKRLFKQTTQAICNKVGYSPNAVRSAISSLIAKGFLIKSEPQKREEGSYHPYYDNIAHHLKMVVERVQVNLEIGWSRCTDLLLVIVIPNSLELLLVSQVF